MATNNKKIVNNTGLLPLGSELEKSLSAGVPAQELMKWVQAALQHDNARHRPNNNTIRQEMNSNNQMSYSSQRPALKNPGLLKPMDSLSVIGESIDEVGKSRTVRTSVELPTLRSLIERMSNRDRSTDGDLDGEDLDRRSKLRSRFAGNPTTGKRANDRSIGTSPSQTFPVEITMGSSYGILSSQVSDELLLQHINVDTTAIDVALRQLADQLSLQLLKERGLQTLLAASKKESLRANAESELLRKVVLSNDEEKAGMLQSIDELSDELERTRMQLEQLAAETYLSTRYRADLEAQRRQDVGGEIKGIAETLFPTTSSKIIFAHDVPTVRGRETLRIMEAVRIALDDLALEDAALRADEGDMSHNSVFDLGGMMATDNTEAEDLLRQKRIISGLGADMGPTPVDGDDDNAEEGTSISPMEERSVVMAADFDTNNGQGINRDGNVEIPAFQSVNTSQGREEETLLATAIFAEGGENKEAAGDIDDDTTAIHSGRSPPLPSFQVPPTKGKIISIQATGIQTNQRTTTKRALRDKELVKDTERATVLPVTPGTNEGGPRDNYPSKTPPATHANHNQNQQVLHHDSSILSVITSHTPQISSPASTEWSGRIGPNTTRQRSSNYHFPTSAGGNGNQSYFGTHLGSSGGGSRGGTVRSSGRHSSTSPNDLKVIEMQKRVDDLTRNNAYLRSRCDEVHRHNKALQMAALDHHDQLSHTRHRMETLQEQLATVLKNTDSVLAQKGKQLAGLEGTIVPQLRQTIVGLESQVALLQESLSSAHKDLFTHQMQSERAAAQAEERCRKLEAEKAAAELLLAKREVALAAIPGDMTKKWQPRTNERSAKSHSNAIGDNSEAGHHQSMIGPPPTDNFDYKQSSLPATSRLTRPKLLLAPITPPTVVNDESLPTNTVDGMTSVTERKWANLVSTLNADIFNGRLEAERGKGPPRKRI